MKHWCVWVWFTAGLFMACSSENQWLATALNLAGDNRAELQKVLDRYKEEDGDKYRAEMCIRDRGEAPEEMLSAENIRWHGQSLWGLDAGKSVLTKSDFPSSGCSIVPQKVINMDADMLRVFDFVMVDDFTFIVPDGSGSSRFCWVNYQGKLLRRTGQIPVSYTHLDVYKRQVYKLSKLCVKRVSNH